MSGDVLGSGFVVIDFVVKERCFSVEKKGQGHKYEGKEMDGNRKSQMKRSSKGQGGRDKSQRGEGERAIERDWEMNRQME